MVSLLLYRVVSSIRSSSREQWRKSIIIHRTFTSTTNNNKYKRLSPEEAGKLAYKTRIEYDNNNKNKNHIILSSSLDTILSHAGLSSSSKSQPPELQNEPLCPPIHLETTYTRPSSGDYNNSQEGGKGWVYTRMGNPTRMLLEDVLTHLEMMSTNDSSNDKQRLIDNSSVQIIEDAVTCAFSSGMAAVSSIILALSKKNLHIILPDDIYHGVPTQLKDIFTQYGVTYSSVNMTDIQNIQNEIDNKDNHDNILIWMESPSNPLCKVIDIRHVCKWVQTYREKNINTKIVTIVDSTWAPPCITQPVLLGADAVLHSGTKYLAGHSDVLLGSVTTSPYTTEGRILGNQIRTIQKSLGATASPMDCWLTLRGLRTLHIRIERQCKNAMEIATFLSNHPHVKSVHYPGLKNHPQHSIAVSQMNSNMFGGMLSFEVLNEAMAMAVAGSVSTIKRATSLGGTETLIEHRASIEPEDGRVSPPGLLRVSIGLEDVEDLKADLDIALRIGDDVINNRKN